MRRVIAALVVVGLAIAVVVLWPRSDDVNTAGEVTTTTSTSTTAPDSTTTTSTTVATTSTTSVLDDHVVETVEEAEAIIASHYYRWFRGIYEEDASLIRSTVILDEQVDAAIAQFGQMEFTSEPHPEGFSFAETEILESNAHCLAVWTIVSASFRAGSSEGVLVFRTVNSEWKFLSSWQSTADLWEADCESSL
jgi:hypothetical protein